MHRDLVANRLDGLVRAAPGRVSVAVRADDGFSWSHDGERVTRAASTIKVPVLLTILRLVERGVLDLHEPVRLADPADRVGGAGALVLVPSVTSLPLVEALRLMIALSDNDAANAVIDHAGLLTTNALGTLMAEVPTRATALRRRFMDTAAAARGVENETCATDLGDLLAALREGRLLGPDATHTALDILRNQQLRAGLPAYLPDEVLVGSKTGDLAGLRADLAVFERGPHWVTVCVVADGLMDGAVDRGTAVLPVFASMGAAAAALLDPG